MPDSLTRSLTRAELTEEFEHLLKSGAPVACIIVDVDGMKGFNEAVGHILGDEALVTMARRIAAAAGPDAVVGRIGGDEFVILNNASDRADVEQAAERIANAAIATPVLHVETPHTLTESELNDARGRVFFLGPDEAGHLAIAPVRGKQPALPLVEPSPGALVATAYLSLSAGVALSAEVEGDYVSLLQAAEKPMLEEKQRLHSWREQLRLAQEGR